MTRRLICLASLAMVCLFARPVHAQDVPSMDPPAHISFVDGSAALERDGQIDSELASMPLLAGDRLRTQGGRVEVLFADGSALHLDANTVVDFQSDEVVRLLDGRIRLSITGPARDVSYRIDAPSAWVQINDPGEYRVAIVQGTDVELAVLRGAAELINEQGRSYIRAGERTFARAGEAPSAPYVFNSAAWDVFDQWSESRRSARLGSSAQYLPNDIRPYAATFDTYGSWRHEPQYGYVWYPRVQVGWRPYHYGRWVSLRPYGWTWVAHDPWGWPTHHYGRWGFSAGVWFWIPGRHWGPAWVSWAYASDYVSWCPLGWNNRPLFSIVNVNIFGGRRYSPWDAWTVVPRHHFGRAHFNVRRAAIVRIDQRVYNTFVVRDRAPEARFAVSRSGAPIRSAGRYAVPRSGVGASAGARAAERRAGPAASPSVERRSPAPARTPGTSSRTELGVDSSRAAGSRAVSRERGAGSGTFASPRSTTSVPAPGVSGGPESRRAPGVSSRRRTGDPAPAVTAPPPGAVRAVPRSRQSQSVQAPAREPSVESPRVRPERGPAYTPSPSSPPPQRSPGAVDVYRSPRSRSPQSASPARPAPDSRRMPDAGAEYRGRSAPRRAAPSAPPPRNDAPPTFRSAPERRSAPSGAPPSAAPARPSGGDRAPATSGGRQRSGGDSGSGRARRR